MSIFGDLAFVLLDIKNLEKKWMWDRIFQRGKHATVRQMLCFVCQKITIFARVFMTAKVSIKAVDSFIVLWFAKLYKYLPDCIQF